MANQCTKFEISRFSCSKDILRGLKFYMGHVMLPCSFQSFSS